MIRRIVRTIARRRQPQPIPPMADCCAACGRLIYSERQVRRPGCQHCDDCERDIVMRARRAGM